MYKSAHKYSENVVFYFDEWGNKHIATGGSVAWRIKNPGLIRSRNPAASTNGYIGSYDGLAIFPEPEQGLQALSQWLRSKMIQKTTLKGIAEYYRPGNFNHFLEQLTGSLRMLANQKIETFSKTNLEKLQLILCKLCGYTIIGDEKFTLLPKIIAKIEYENHNDDAYLVANTVLSKKEAIDWVLTHRLDAVVVHERNGNVHLRSRPYHQTQHLRISENDIWFFEGQIETLSRSIGQKSTDQYIWGFINGVSNNKKDALESAELISRITGGEEVLSMPNDQLLLGFGDIITCALQKLLIDTPVVDLAVKFFRCLIALSENNPKHPAVIVFVHSQGAIITEHALEHLTANERNQLRIFSFGGGSFIAPGKSHPDSHNYVSATDLVPGAAIPGTGIYDHRQFCLYYYYCKQQGRTNKQIIDTLVIRDAMLSSDSEIYLGKPDQWLQHRARYYEDLLKNVFNNITILEPGNYLEHAFKNECYQNAVKGIVKFYKESKQDLLVESQR